MEPVKGILKKSNSNLTPEKIISTLFQAHNQFHFYHLQTTSFAEHKALDEMYNGLVDYKDSISEYLLGIQAPKRFSNLETSIILPYSSSNVTKSIEDLFQFTKDLCEYADKLNLEQLCNLSSELQGLTIRIKYLLTLK